MRLHHAAVVCESLENADRFYEGVLELGKKKIQTLDAGLSEQIFGISSPCQMVLYGNDDIAIEVFIPPRTPQKTRGFGHLCLQVENRATFLEACGVAGLAVKKILKGESWVVFLEDYDGNLFEIKELPA